jgi:thymidylate synthase (FAD)
MARLISYTQSCIPECETPIDLVAFCARVSNPENQNNKETAGRLLKYLIKHAHWSPLQMVDATVELEIPRDIGRQILRHQSFDFQEFSQRYAEALGFAEPRECRLQDTTNRQNSLPCLDQELSDWWYFTQKAVINASRSIYEEALKRGIAKEQARVVLPEGLTLSRMYMKGSLRSWVHYLQVRQDPTTQKEHREIAFAIADCISRVFGGMVQTQQVTA